MNPTNQVALAEPPTQIQQELQELRGVIRELEQAVQDLWTRLATVVLPPASLANKNPTPAKDGGVPLANELRELVLRLNETTGSLHALRGAIQL